ncbi:hypothetical protein ACW5WN_01225 [Aeromonas lacus]|uniref:hypothetical protein n=1 Tax=Aeromonas lacus TaxID=558884 RepID=UPI00051C62C3|nr:hypothetical protein [Aeromonas lacus]
MADSTKPIFTVQDIEEPKQDPQLRMNGIPVPVFLYEVQGSKRLIAAKALYNEFPNAQQTTIDPEVRDCILQYVDRYNALSEQADRQGAHMLNPGELVMQAELNRSMRRLQDALAKGEQK